MPLVAPVTTTVLFAKFHMDFLAYALDNSIYVGGISER
jgi:hypothetical protein